MYSGNIMDKLHNDNCLANPSTTISSYLTPSGKGGDEVNHLKTGLQHLGSGFLLLEGRRRAVNWPMFFSFNLSQVI